MLIDLSNDIKWADNASESLRQLVTERTEGKKLTITFTHNHGDHVGMLHAYIKDPNVHFALPETDFASLVSNYSEASYSFINEGDLFDLGNICPEKFIYRDEDIVFRQIDEHTWVGNGHHVYN